MPRISTIGFKVLKEDKRTIFSAAAHALPIFSTACNRNSRQTRRAPWPESPETRRPCWIPGRPFDPSGAPGTTNDVFVGARISLTIEHDGEQFPDQAAADRFAAGYLKMVRFSLFDAAKAGRITSKTLAETKFTKAELVQRARERRQSVKRSKKAQAEFLNSLDPVTRRAIIETGKELRAKRKAEGKNRGGTAKTVVNRIIT